MAGVKVGAITPRQQAPVQIVPLSSEFDLIGWCRTHQALVDELLPAHRALLFRGCGLEDIEQFERVAEAISRAPRLMCHGRQPYRGPRTIAVMMTEPHDPSEA